MDGALDEFWGNRPELTDRQKAVLSCYYQARRDNATPPDGRISKSALIEACQQIDYETDLAVLLMQSLDDYYLHLRLEDMKRKAAKK